jgi:murein DD-endopeptidase MepM/ murein hydrolase activator NlpD
MPDRPRLRTAATSTVMLGCLVAALSMPPSAAQATPSAPHLPAYKKERGTVFEAKPPTAVLPVSGYHLTGRFGDVSGYWSSVHTGLDFAAPYGSPIHSVASGVVVFVAYDGAFGNKTVVRLGDGTEVWYCHQSEQVVAVGDRVAVGEVIGYIGTTGNTTGPHLHLEWHPHGGDAVDPFTALRGLGLRP